MCGRYIIRQHAKALREWEKYGLPPFLESYNVAPTQQVPILRMNADSADDERSRRRIVNGAAAVDAGVLVFTSGVHDASSVSRLSP
ncbi:MAG: hypothetical protein WBE65_08555 [Steroidobacteraceae bacterium]